MTLAISSTFANLLVETLREQGILPQGYATSSGRYNSKKEMPIEQWTQLLDHASNCMPDTVPAIEIGKRTEAHHMGIVGYALQASGDVRELLRRYSQYHCTIVQDVPILIDESQSFVSLSWKVEARHRMLDSNLLAVTAMTTFIRKTTGIDSFTPRRVGFVDDVPPYVNVIQLVLGDNISFNNQSVIYEVAGEILDQPLLSSDMHLVSLLQDTIDGLLPNRERKLEVSGFLGQVHDLLANGLASREFSIEHISQKLHMSKRTFTRRLASHGTSYRRELRKVRQETTKTYLCDGRIPLVEIAQLVGFEDQSSFTRSFKTWTGLSPLEWKATINQ